MSARRLHRGQMRAEDPAFLVLHLDTDAAPAVDGPHDDAAPRRSDARADGLEAHTVAALELVAQCFRSNAGDTGSRPIGRAAGPQPTPARRTRRPNSGGRAGDRTSYVLVTVLDGIPIHFAVCTPEGRPLPRTRPCDSSPPRRVRRRGRGRPRCGCRGGRFGPPPHRPCAPPSRVWGPAPSRDRRGPRTPRPTTAHAAGRRGSAVRGFMSSAGQAPATPRAPAWASCGRCTPSSPVSARRPSA